MSTTNKISIPRFYYIVVLILTYLSADTLLFGTNASETMHSIRSYAALMLCAVFFWQLIMKKGFRIQQGLFILYILLVLCIFINFFIAPGENIIKNYIYQVLIITVGMLTVTTIDLRSFSVCFINLMVLFSLISFLIFVISQIDTSWMSAFPSIINVGGVEFKSLYFTNIPIYSWFSKRNYCIFREPGVAQFYFNVAILLNIQVEGFNIKKIVPLILGVMSTFSTSGFLCLAMILVIYFSQKYKGHNKKALLILTVMSLLLCAFYMLSADLFTYTFDKLFQGEGGTAASRYKSIEANLIMWLKRPLFGVGAYEVERLFNQMENSGQLSAATDNTNTILYFFSCFGLIFGTVFTAGIVRFCKKISTGRYFLIVLFFLMLWSSQNMWRSYIPYIIMFYGYLKAQTAEKYIIRQ